MSWLECGNINIAIPVHCPQITLFTRYKRVRGFQQHLLSHPKKKNLSPRSAAQLFCLVFNRHGTHWDSSAVMLVAASNVDQQTHVKSGKEVELSALNRHCDSSAQSIARRLYQPRYYLNWSKEYVHMLPNLHCLQENTLFLSRFVWKLDFPGNWKVPSQYLCLMQFVFDCTVGLLLTTMILQQFQIDETRA